MYSVIIKAILLLGIAAVFTAGAVKLLRRSRRMTRSEFKLRLKQSAFFKASALLMAIIMSGVFTVFSFIDAKQEAEAVISLNYAEASLGQNANGTRYNMSEIICNDVLKRAIEKGGLEGVAVKDLKSCLSVEAFVQGNSFNKDEYHISTEFLVRYKANRKTRKYDAEKIVQLISNAYKDYYFDKYVSDFKITADDMKTELAKLDYMQSAAYLEKEVTIILNYLYGLREINASFISSDNSTFASVSQKAEQLDEVQINQNLVPYILQNGLSKDTPRYLDSLSYNNLMMGFDRDKASASYDVTNRAIGMYSKEMTRVVLVPTWDSDGKYYMGRTKVGIDELSVQATDFSDKKVELAEKIQRNDLIRSKMSAVGSNNEYTRANADEMLQNICMNIQAYADEARKIGHEYYANQMNGCISITVRGASLLAQAKAAFPVFIAAYLAFIIYAAAAELLKEEEAAESDGR